MKTNICKVDLDGRPVGLILRGEGLWHWYPNQYGRVLPPAPFKRMQAVFAYIESGIPLFRAAMEGR